MARIFPSGAALISVVSSAVQRSRRGMYNSSQWRGCCHYQIYILHKGFPTIGSDGVLKVLELSWMREAVIKQQGFLAGDGI